MNMKNYFSDICVLTGRVLKHNFRSVDTIITVVAMPVLMMLAFVYIFGGAMNLGEIKYINYIVPGILALGIISGIAYTAYRVNNDVTKGIFERLHSMPISKSAILGGHVISSVIFNIVSIIVILIVAFLIGFRPDGNIIDWISATFMIVLFTFAMTWIAVTFGLLAKSGETAGVFSYILMILAFTSSAIAPTETMAKGLAAFATHQPMTPIINSIRSLLMGEDVGNTIWIAVAWCIGIIIVFRIFAIKIYKSRMK